jgi:hypothetical protein
MSSEEIFIKLLTNKPTKDQLKLLENEEYEKYYSIYGIDIYGFENYNSNNKNILRFEEYICKILFHFRYLEIISDDRDYYYYNNIEFDSNQTWFEYLGNQNLVGIKTNLNYHLANIILKIYNAVFSNNSYLLYSCIIDYKTGCFYNIAYDYNTIIKEIDDDFYKKNDNNYSQKNNCYYLTINQIIDIFNYKIYIQKKY